jgi:hypothetical protein
MLELKNNRDFHALAQEALRGRFQQFAEEAQRVMADGVVRLRLATQAQRIVVIIDSLEKVRSVGESDRPDVESSVESVFVHHADFLRIPCHSIYTFPLWLRFKTAALGARYDNAPLILPMVKITEPGGAPYAPGIEKLGQLVARRVDMDVVFGPDPFAALRPIIEASGGYPRDLLRMVRDLIRRATSFPVHHDEVATITDLLAEEYSHIIRAPDLDLLQQVATTHKLPRGDEKELAAFGRLLERWLVLAYRNGREWYDLHPLVRRSSLVEERLRAPA